MKRWSGIVVSVGMASLAGAADAQNCEAIPVGPARTDCYIGLSRISQGQSAIAAGTAHAQSSAARYHQVTGKSPRQRRNRVTK
jgi:hypothetical protein